MNAAAGKPAHGQPGTPSLTRYAWLSILAAMLTMALKAQAYRMTGSVGMLSDAAESLVNLAAALVALLMLSIAARPADTGHPFGHGKAEYFASGFEGALILVAAVGIAWAAWGRLWNLQPLAALDLGMAVSAVAAVVNLVVALVLLRAGRKHDSITLEADGRHLLSDVWTTLAVLSALGGITLTGWLWLDPAIAFLAAAQIVWSGVSLIRRSIAGLLDAALPAKERAAIEAIFNRYRLEGVGFHDLRTRAAGTQRFMTVHVLVPGDCSVKRGHDLLERLEGEIRQAIRHLTIVTHLEPLDDAASFAHDRIASEAADWPQPPQQVATASARPKPRARKATGRLALLVGPLLLFAGGAASMGLTGLYADIAMGLSLLGLVMSLVGLRRAKHAS
ncbi:cation diffusion facilitator family transporter [Methylomagnum sp.]